MSSPDQKHWTPLEANPDVFTAFARKLGLPASSARFVDVYGLDEDLLQFVPRPVYALILLFPITDSTEAARRKEHDALVAAGYAPHPSIFHMKQTVGNACGVIAAVHALAAAASHLPPAVPGGASPFAPGSFLADFLADAPRLEGSAARGARLEHPPGGAPDISGAAAAAGAGGQTAAPPPDADVDTHFCALVPAVVPDDDGGGGGGGGAGGDGWRAWRLVELDGRKAFAVDHGPLASGRCLDSVLPDAAAVARRFMDTVGPDSIQFSLMALVGGGDGGEGEEA